MNTGQQIKDILNQIAAHQEDLPYLSNCIVQLSTMLYNLGEEMSEARLLENQTTLSYLELIPLDGSKKMSVAESQLRGEVDTNGAYSKLKTNYESVIEIIQSLKKKIDATAQQLRSGV